MPKINLSFKQTTRDMKLFLITDSKEEKSEFIKDAIEYYLKYLEKSDFIDEAIEYYLNEKQIKDK